MEQALSDAIRIRRIVEANTGLVFSGDDKAPKIDNDFFDKIDFEKSPKGLKNIDRKLAQTLVVSLLPILQEGLSYELTHQRKIIEKYERIRKRKRRDKLFIYMLPSIRNIQIASENASSLMNKIDQKLPNVKTLSEISQYISSFESSYISIREANAKTIKQIRDVEKYDDDKIRKNAAIYSAVTTVVIFFLSELISRILLPAA